MKDLHIPCNQRERVSQSGWRDKQRKLMKLGEPDEWRSMRWGVTVCHKV